MLGVRRLGQAEARMTERGVKASRLFAAGYRVVLLIDEPMIETRTQGVRRAFGSSLGRSEVEDRPVRWQRENENLYLWQRELSGSGEGRPSIG